jgi:UDP-2,4-diacetamido-2,4,6-trideoxy-beta-L-altropyranose hydrolase
MQIGSGHVMRCLTLADALKAQGMECHFICREHLGHLLEVISSRGFIATALPAFQTCIEGDIERFPLPDHVDMLGCDWQSDAQQAHDILARLQPEWLIVDHYALDHRWEAALQPDYRKLLVIDDLANRAHNCDVLLDQNLGRARQDYAGLVPPYCDVITGPQFALLRPEFAELRPYSLQRRQPAVIRHVLVSMGGMDATNATSRVLQGFKSCVLPRDFRISVVMGPSAPNLHLVQEQAQATPWPTVVVVNVSDMAQRMADSDLAIGAAGSTSWERCCLALPTLIVVLAENQMLSAKALHDAQAASVIGGGGDILTKLPAAVRSLTCPNRLREMSEAASGVTDGRGVERLLKILGDKSG